MKTAISVDDDLLREADRIAKRRGVSRSRLISLALGEYLRRQRQEEMIEQLNRVYSSDPRAEPETARKLKARFRRTVKERW